MPLPRPAQLGRARSQCAEPDDVDDQVFGRPPGHDPGPVAGAPGTVVLGLSRSAHVPAPGRSSVSACSPTKLVGLRREHRRAAGDQARSGPGRRHWQGCTSAGRGSPPASRPGPIGELDTRRRVLAGEVEPPWRKEHRLALPRRKTSQGAKFDPASSSPQALAPWPWWIATAVSASAPVPHLVGQGHARLIYTAVFTVIAGAMQSFGMA